MTAIKKTLLQIVRDILNNLDSEDVNSISDSVEAQQIASIVEQIYYQHVASLEVPEHAGLLNITAAANSDTPTHFTIPDNVRKIETLWYSKDATYDYREIYYMDPKDFIIMADGVQSTYDNVTVGGTNLRIRSDKNPEYYTTFDDNTIIMDSYDSSIESTLQESKVRAWGWTIPIFSITDSYVPDIDASMFPYLTAEATSAAFEWLKGSGSSKAEQYARRTRARVHNDMHRVNKPNKRPNYGRR